MDKIPTMAKKTLIVDTGSWTIDIMPVINKSPDESKGVTIPKGLIICMRSINEQCVRQLKSDATESANASNGSAGAKPVRILRGKSLSGKILSQTECCTGHIRRSKRKR